MLSFDLQQSSTLKAIQVVNWMPSNQSVRDCEVRGQPKHLCHNFVNLIFPSPNGFHLADDGSQSERVSPKDIVWDDEPHTIDSNDRLLLVCGTNAFRPNCTWRSSIDLNLIRQTQDGHLKTSRSPAHQFDAMFSSDGELQYQRLVDTVRVTNCAALL